MSQHLFSLPERNNIDDAFYSDYRAKYMKSNIPIVIDNGINNSFILFSPYLFVFLSIFSIIIINK